MNFSRSQEVYQEAVQVIPGGVNSPVRAFGAVGDYPIFIDHGQGSKVTDVDGNDLIDYVCSWGPLILGHGRPEIKEAMAQAIEKGTTFGMPTAIEVEMAERITRLVDSIEKVRMVSSGTEATMSAIRLARGYTGRDKIVKFRGCYHGHVDSLLIEAGSGALTFGVPSSPGVPAKAAEDTLLAEYNDLASVEALFEAHGDQIAGVILEPIAGNMGLVPPVDGFLQGLRDITQQHGALLIFDEVISGFRVGLGGAQALYGVRPDLTCFGKIIGGGLPVGAFGGRADIMDHISPAGPVYQAGTLSGNPLAMAAGLKTLELLEKEAPFQAMEEKMARLAQGLRDVAAKHKVPVFVRQLGSLMTVFFNDNEVTTYAQAQASDTEAFGIFFQAMLQEGVHLPPAQFECWFISAVHSDADIEHTLAAADRAFAKVADQRA